MEFKLPTLQDLQGPDLFWLAELNSGVPSAFPESMTGLVDSVITSPPYNLGISYAPGVSDSLAEPAYLDLLRRVFVTLSRILRPNGVVWWNYGVPREDPGRAFRILDRVQDLFQIQNTLIWMKSGTTPAPNGEYSWGRFRPVNSRTLLHGCWEYVFQLRKTGQDPVPLDRLALGVPYVDKSNLDRFGDQDREDLRCRGNVWCIPYPTNLSRLHPAPFPPALARNCLRLQGLTGGVVLDPFCGIGGSGIAAIQTGNRFIGIDRVPGFLETAERFFRVEVARLKPQPADEIQGWMP